MRLLVAMFLCMCSVFAQQAGVAGGLRVIVIDGDDAADIVAERIAAEPVIEVRDRENRRVAGAVVRFLIRRTLRDRIAAMFRDGQAEARTLTDAAGRATTDAIIPIEPGNYEIEVEVSYQGLAATTTIRHTNYATAADAQAAGRQPGQSAGSTGATAAGPAAGAAGATAAGQAAAVGGGGLSKLTVISLVAGSAVTAGAAAVLSRKPSDPRPAGTVAGVTAQQPDGVQSATPFRFSVQVANFDPGSLGYRWDFGDGASSTEEAPTHVYNSAGVFTVAVTVSDARQSVRSEMSITVHSATGTWVSVSGSTTMQLTQSGAALTGVASVETGPTSAPYTSCALAGSVQYSPGTATLFVLSRPACTHPIFAPLIPAEYRLNMVVGGQVLSGVVVSILSTGPIATDPIQLRR